MKCPNCLAEIKYKERSNNRCTKCRGTFVFEPKANSLGLTDAYFLRTVEKLGDNGKFFFTPEQFYFALHRKQLRAKNSLAGFVFLAAFTLIPAFIASRIIAAVIALFWICFFVYRFFFASKAVSPKMEFSEFNYDVLQAWKRVHKTLPPNFLTGKAESKFPVENPRGFLLCDAQSTANFLIANDLENSLNVLISSDADFPKNKFPAKSPIFVLHDASFDGFKFVAEIERIYADERKIFDIGLRPHEAKELEIAQFRRKNLIGANIDSLTNEENKWLEKGFYAPLYVLKPLHLLKMTTNKIKRKFAETENI